MKHNIHPELLTRPVKVCLIGAGGTGSNILSGLIRLHMSLLAKGHPYGLEVSVFDGDVVTDANIGRQLFYPADKGVNKAICLVNRANVFFGLRFKAFPRNFTANDVSSGSYFNGFHLYISAVDTKAARREIARGFWHRLGTNPVYFLDSGNRLDDGQVVLGEPLSKAMKGKNALPMRLPTIFDFAPEILAEDAVEDDTPSCSLAASLEKQSLFICQEVATRGLNLLWRLFTDAGLDFHGQFTNLKSGRTAPIMVDEKVWKRMIPKKVNYAKLLG